MHLEPTFLLPDAWGIHVPHMIISYPSFCLITGRSFEGEGGTVLGATARVCISWPSPEVVTWSAISTIVPRSNSSMIASGTFSAGSHVTAHFSFPNPRVVYFELEMRCCMLGEPFPGRA